MSNLVRAVLVVAGIVVAIAVGWFMWTIFPQPQVWGWYCEHGWFTPFGCQQTVSAAPAPDAVPPTPTDEMPITSPPPNLTVITLSDRLTVLEAQLSAVGVDVKTLVDAKNIVQQPGATTEQMVNAFKEVLKEFPHIAETGQYGTILEYIPGTGKNDPDRFKVQRSDGSIVWYYCTQMDGTPPPTGTGSVLGPLLVFDHTVQILHEVVVVKITATPGASNTPGPSPTDTLVTATPVPPTATNTAVPPTATNTPVPATATNTNVPPTRTNTPVPATATNTAIPPTATNTPLPTHTTLPGTDTATPPPTNTSVPPTATNTSVPPTATNTAVPPTATNTSVPPTVTNTSVPPTRTNTPVPPTETNTAVTPTVTPTPSNTPPGPSPTNTPSRVPPSDTPVPPTEVPPTVTSTATWTPTRPPYPPPPTPTNWVVICEPGDWICWCWCQVDPDHYKCPTPTPTATATQGPSPTPTATVPCPWCCILCTPVPTHTPTATECPPWEDLVEPCNWDPSDLGYAEIHVTSDGYGFVPGWEVTESGSGTCGSGSCQLKILHPGTHFLDLREARVMIRKRGCDKSLQDLIDEEIVTQQLKEGCKNVTVTHKYDTSGNPPPTIAWCKVSFVCRTVLTGKGNTMPFNKDDQVTGYEIKLISGVTYRDCTFMSAPSAGTVTDGGTCLDCKDHRPACTAVNIVNVASIMGISPGRRVQSTAVPFTGGIRPGRRVAVAQPSATQQRIFTIQPTSEPLVLPNGDPTFPPPPLPEPTARVHRTSGELNPGENWIVYDGVIIRPNQVPSRWDVGVSGGCKLLSKWSGEIVTGKLLFDDEEFPTGMEDCYTPQGQ